jgi:hypothetical protein
VGSGVWGLVFLMAWLAPAVKEVWEGGIAWRVLHDSLAPFAGVCLAMLVYGKEGID